MSNLIEKRSPQERLIIAKTLLDGVIEDLPSAQPEPKTGRWIYQFGMIKCDQCLRAIRRIDHDGILNFCPNCGADMRGEQNEP